MEIAILSIIISVLILLIPVFFMYRPSKEINGLYGYRTPRSMENKKNWDMAQRYFPKVLFKFSLLSVISLVLLSFFHDLSVSLALALGIWSIGAFITILLTEMHLKNQN